MIQNHIGSSETTRESPFYNFDFANYIKYHRPVASHHKCKEDIYITTHFLEWFIGFAEGYGSFESRLVEGWPDKNAVFVSLSFTIVQKDKF